MYVCVLDLIIMLSDILEFWSQDDFTERWQGVRIHPHVHNTMRRYPCIENANRDVWFLNTNTNADTYSVWTCSMSLKRDLSFRKRTCCRLWLQFVTFYRFRQVRHTQDRRSVNNSWRVIATSLCISVNLKFYHQATTTLLTYSLVNTIATSK